MNEPYTRVGWDLGRGASQTVYFYVDPKTGKSITLTQAEAEAMHEAGHAAAARKRWGERLLIDLRVAKTTGADQRTWRMAQLYLCTGREVKIQWRTTS